MPPTPPPDDGRWTLAAIQFSGRQTDYLDEVADNPNEIDLHNDGDLIVDLLRSIAHQLRIGE